MVNNSFNVVVDTNVITSLVHSRYLLALPVILVILVILIIF